MAKAKRKAAPSKVAAAAASDAARSHCEDGPENKRRRLRKTATEEQASRAVKERLPHLSAGDAHHWHVDGSTAYQEALATMRARKKNPQMLKMGARYYRQLCQKYRCAEDDSSSSAKGKHMYADLHHSVMSGNDDQEATK